MAKKTKKDTDANNTPLIATPAGNEMQIPMELIVAEDDFNARKDLLGKTDEGHSIESLAKTIEMEGQLSPIMVANLAEFPGKFYLVAGFRRFYAMSWPKEKGGLGLRTIRATIYQPVDSKGNPVTPTLAELKYVNLIENEARKALNPYERAVRYHDLVKNHEDTGNKIAKRVSLDPSYVNRLIAAMDMHPKVVERFAMEWSPNFEGTRFLTMDQLNKLTHMRIKDKDGKSTERQDHESQLKWLEEKLAPKPDADEDDEDKDGDDKDDKDDKDENAKRASLSQIKRAIAAANLALKNANNTKDHARFEAILEGLRFAVKPRKIEGVLSLKDGGKMILGPDGKAAIATKS